MLPWLHALDIQLFRFINDTLSCAVLDILLPILDSHSFFVPAVLLLLAGLCWKDGARGRLFVAALLLALILGEVGLVGPLKEAVGRARPFAALEGVHLLSGRGTSGSMPSAHTTIWFAATTLAFAYYPRSWRFLLPLALVMGFSRVYLGVHYPSDVLVGALLGTAYAAAVLGTVSALWAWLGPRWFPLWWRRMPVFVVRGPPTPLAVPASEPGNVAALREAQYLHLGWVLIAVVFLARLAYVASDKIQLSEDEAYQWLWSKNPALSYFSKPPLIAWTQWLGTRLWGDTELGVRFFAPVIAAALGLLVLRFLAQVASARVGLCAVLLLNFTPLLEVGAVLMTVDPLLVLFWTAALIAGWKAVQPAGTTAHWIWVGVWTGLGLLSKYTALAQVGCWAIFFALHRPAQVHLRRPGPWLALVVVAVCALPVLIWNGQHGWITLSHLSSNAQWERKWEPTLQHVLDFTSAQAGLLNPICFVAALWSALAFWRRDRAQPLLVFLFAMGTPLFLGYWLLTLHSRVHPNWIAAAVVPMFCHMAVYWDRRWQEGVRAVKTWFIAALALGAVTMPFLHEPDLTLKVVRFRLPAKADPLRRVRGIESFARIVARERDKLLREGRPVFVLTGHYGPAGQLSFYLPDARQGLPQAPLVYCRLGDAPRNQFYFWPQYRYRDQRRGQNALYVQFDDGSKPAPQAVHAEFESVTDLGVFEIKHNRRVFHRLHVFACRQLR